MLERISPDIEIKRLVWDSEDEALVEQVVLTAPITVDSRRNFHLMERDQISLKFANDVAVPIKIGDYVDDELFGKFVVVDEYMPEYDMATGAYKYDIILESYYMAIFKNKQLMLTAVRYGTSTRYRKESNWSLTAQLSVHIDEVLNNLSVLGYTYAKDIHDEDIPTAYEAIHIEYNSASIFAALGAIAGNYKCEWWVTKENNVPTIHLGKCEIDSDESTFQLGVNAEYISIQKNADDYANKIFAYGSTKNLPSTYRKSLILHLTELENPYYSSTGMYCRACRFDKAIKSTWLKGDTPLGGYGVESHDESPDDDDESGNILYTFLGGPAPDATGPVFLDTGETYDYSAQFWVNVISEYSSPNIYDTINVSLILFPVDTSEFAYDEIVISEARYSLTGDIGPDTRQQLIQVDTSFKVPQISGHSRVRYQIRVVVDCDFRSRYVSGYEQYTDRLFLSALPGIPLNQCISIGEPAPVFRSAYIYPYDTTTGETDTEHGLEITFNAAALNGIPDPNYQWENWFDFEAYKGTSTTRPGLPPGISLGDAFVMQISDGTSEGLLITEIPDALYTDTIDATNTLAMNGETRLQLPLDTGGYLISKRLGPENANPLAIVEQTVIFDDVFPRCVLRITNVAEKTRTQVTEYADGSKNTTEYPEFTIEGERITGTTTEEFIFRKSYVMPGETLQIKFLTPEEEADAAKAGLGPGETYVSPCIRGTNYKLAGMTFDVSFNALYNSYTIVRNTDYGKEFPNKILAPAANDPFILIGWNTKAMDALGLIEDAEQALKTKAEEYLEALEEAQFVFTCNMMSDYPFQLNAKPLYDSNNNPVYVEKDGDYILFFVADNTAYVMPLEGTKVKIVHGALSIPVLNEETEEYEDVHYKESRILGYEFHLDRPFVSPVYEVGETEAYSRLKDIESRLTKIGDATKASSNTSQTTVIVSGGGGSSTDLSGIERQLAKI